MKKSNNIVLTAVFMAAISTVAKGQDVSSHDRNEPRRDSTDRHTSYVNTESTVTTRRGFLGLFRSHHSSPPQGGHSTAPRSSGFGNTLRSAST